MTGLHRCLRAKKAVILICGLLALVLVYTNWNNSDDAKGPDLSSKAWPRTVNSLSKGSNVFRSVHNVTSHRHSYGQKLPKGEHAYSNASLQIHQDDKEHNENILEDRNNGIQRDEQVEGKVSNARHPENLRITDQISRNGLAIKETALGDKTRHEQLRNGIKRAGQYIEGESPNARHPEDAHVPGMEPLNGLSMKEQPVRDKTYEQLQNDPPILQDETVGIQNKKQSVLRNDVGANRKNFKYVRQANYFNNYMYKHKKNPDDHSVRDLDKPTFSRGEEGRPGKKVYNYRKAADNQQGIINRLRANRQGQTIPESMSEDTLGQMLQSQLEANRLAKMESKTKAETETDITFSSVGKTIVIIGFHRTGSTLLGTTLKEYPGSFYLFEILHLTSFVNELTFLNGTRIYNIWGSYHQVEEHILRSLLSCEFDQLPLELLMDQHHVDHSDSLENMVYCLQRVFSEQFDNTMIEIREFSVNKSENVIRVYADSVSKLPNAAAILNAMTSRCLAPAIQACKKAPLRVYKCIKLRMSAMPSALRDTKDVKVVHLLRDPRGNVVSQARLLIPRYSRSISGDPATYRYRYMKKFVAIANSYCTDVRDDIMIKNTLVAKYGENRIFTILYEKFATFPLETTRNLYKFADLDLSSEIEDYLWRLTMSGLKKTCSYCVERGNGTVAAFSWRKYIYPNQLTVINTLCDDIYEMVGVRKFSTFSDVRNTKLPILV